MEKLARNPLYVSQELVDHVLDATMNELDTMARVYGKNFELLGDGSYKTIINAAINNCARRDYPGESIIFSLVFAIDANDFEGSFEKRDRITKISLMFNNRIGNLQIPAIRNWVAQCYRSTITHELAHFEDDQHKKIDGTVREVTEEEYYNQPHEVRAFGREAYDKAMQLVSSGQFDKKQAFDKIMSVTSRVRDFMTEDNKRIFMQLIWAGLVAGEEELENNKQQKPNNIHAKNISKLKSFAYGPVKIDDNLIEAITAKIEKVVKMLYRKGKDNQMLILPGIRDCTKAVNLYDEIAEETGAFVQMKLETDPESFEFHGRLEFKDGSNYMGIVITAPGRMPKDNYDNFQDSMRDELKYVITHELVHVKDLVYKKLKFSTDQDEYTMVASDEYFNNQEEIIAYSKNIYDLAVVNSQFSFDRCKDIVKQKFSFAFHYANPATEKRFLSMIAKGWSDGQAKSAGQSSE